MRRPSHIHFSPGILSTNKDFGDPVINQAVTEISFGYNLITKSNSSTVNRIQAELSVEHAPSSITQSQVSNIGDLQFDFLSSETAFSSNVGSHVPLPVSVNYITSELTVDHSPILFTQDNLLYNSTLSTFESVAVEVAFTAA